MASDFSLPPIAGFERTALNRVTFGARDADVAYVQKIGWNAWVAEQLSPPFGDEPDLAQFLARQTMPIQYNGQPKTDRVPGWPDVNQRRPLNYLTMDVPALWQYPLNVEVSVAANELTRIQQEQNAATWIRNTHASFQLREFMTDFWLNHFNVGRQADIFGSAALPVYESNAIRPRVFGNFEDLITAVATSASMMRYLNNSESTAAHPNENYARELLELHTLGGSSYAGIGTPGQGPIATPADLGDLPAMASGLGGGFTDQDVIQASRALSGWTLEQGQDGPDGSLPNTGNYLFNPLQHNTQAGAFLGIDLSQFSGEAQGQAVISIVAHHPATAGFVVTKLARRMFGDAPPQSVIARGMNAWLMNRDRPDQIARVLSSMLTDGSEIGAPGTKLRRPYERIIAFFRTTDTVVNAFDLADSAVAPLGDGIFVWPTPEGRPDRDIQWMSTASNLYIWNLLLLLLVQPAITTSLAVQTPAAAGQSADSLINYWVGRMVGYQLRPSAMTALIADATARGGIMEAFASPGIANRERTLRRLVALIGCSVEFGFR
jgi:uncharacterized protein (DUF1800 family)